MLPTGGEAAPDAGRIRLSFSPSGSPDDARIVGIASACVGLAVMRLVDASTNDIERMASKNWKVSTDGSSVSKVEGLSNSNASVVAGNLRNDFMAHLFQFEIDENAIATISRAIING